MGERGFLANYQSYLLHEGEQERCRLLRCAHLRAPHVVYVSEIALQHLSVLLRHRQPPQRFLDLVAHRHQLLRQALVVAHQPRCVLAQRRRAASRQGRHLDYFHRVVLPLRPAQAVRQHQPPLGVSVVHLHCEPRMAQQYVRWLVALPGYCVFCHSQRCRNIHLQPHLHRPAKSC